MSFVSAIFLPIPDIYRGIIAIPGAGSLLGALFQLFRDQAKYEKDMHLQEKQNIFNLSVTSHMANVAFDKHVEFCEKYIGKMNEGIQKMFEKGPSEETFPNAVDLMAIRRQYAPWLQKDTVKELADLENNIAIIGISYMEITGDIMDDKSKNEIANQMHDIFDKVFGGSLDIGRLDKDILASNIVNHLQNILGISELTALRKKYLNMAIDS